MNADPARHRLRRMLGDFFIPSEGSNLLFRRGTWPLDMRRAQKLHYQPEFLLP